MFKLIIFFFFFSSRRRHTRCLSDWSSDVCSSDLGCPPRGSPRVLATLHRLALFQLDCWSACRFGQLPPHSRSSRRRRLRHHRANDKFVPFFQSTLGNRRHFRVGVVGDSERHFHRLHAVIRVKFPDDGGV